MQPKSHRSFSELLNNSITSTQVSCSLFTFRMNGCHWGVRCCKVGTSVSVKSQHTKTNSTPDHFDRHFTYSMYNIQYVSLIFVLVCVGVCVCVHVKTICVYVAFSFCTLVLKHFSTFHEKKCYLKLLLNFMTTHEPVGQHCCPNHTK